MGTLMLRQTNGLRVRFSTTIETTLIQFFCFFLSFGGCNQGLWDVELRTRGGGIGWFRARLQLQYIGIGVCGLAFPKDRFARKDFYMRSTHFLKGWMFVDDPNFLSTINVNGQCRSEICRRYLAKTMDINNSHWHAGEVTASGTPTLPSELNFFNPCLVESQ